MKKYGLIFLVIGLVTFLLFYISTLYSPGSYADAETYELSIGESDLILIIQKFKEENPQYKVPDQVGLSDGKGGPQDHWYHIYFYYPKEDQIIYFWTRSNGKQNTTLAFVAVNNSLVLGNWKDINKDFSYSENKSQIEKFENRILRNIKEKINH